MAASRNSSLAACLLALALAAYVVPAFVSGRAGYAATARRGAAVAQPRTVRQVWEDESDLQPSGPIVVYAKALMDGASHAKESVPVTKDILRVRDLFLNEEFKEKLSICQNTYGIYQIDKADRLLGLMGSMESTVLPKFVRFLAKKNRLQSLLPILTEYVTTLYSNQGIVPVVVKSATALTDAQVQMIKNKMKAKTGAKDIKLITELQPSLLAGFTLEWGFVEPEKLEAPSASLDMSLRNALASAALDKGVLMGA